MTRHAAQGSVSLKASEHHPAMKSLTVVLPCLNEAETLDICIRKARAQFDVLGIAGEVIVADNGSTDGSQGVARRAGARVVDISTRGYGAAIMGGVRAARSEQIIMADADDSYALDDLGPFVAALNGGAQLVMGNRFQGGIARGAMPALHRYLGNPALSFVGRTFFDTPIRDFHCGMRGFSKAAILGLDLRTPGMEFASEMVVKASLRGLRISEVPTTLHPDGRTRPPHLRTWRDGWRHLRFLLAYSPRWLFLFPGLALACTGLAGMGWLAGGQRTVGAMHFDLITMLFFAMAVLVGVQAIWFSAIAKVFAINEGLHPPDPATRRWVARFSLERTLLAGFVIALAGLAIMLIQIANWASVDFGELDVFTVGRAAIAGATLFVVGVQTVFSSFLLSLVGIRHTSSM